MNIATRKSVLKLAITCLSLYSGFRVQATIVPEVGVHMPMYFINGYNIINNGNNDGTIKTQYGLTGGFTYNSYIISPFYWQLGAFYQQNNFYENRNASAGTSKSYDLQVNSIFVPVYFMVKTGLPCKPHFLAGAGMFISYNLNAHLTKEIEGSAGTTEIDLKVGGNAGDDLKAINYGVTAYAGYESRSGYSLKCTYSSGMQNLLMQTYSDSYFKLKTVSITVGRSFKKRKRCGY